MFVGGLYLTSTEVIVLLFSDKWLPSVEIFRILILSGFAYPLSALLVNVLMSRGNSRAFLRLEIYKKSIASLNFLVLYLFGVDAFLYGLIVQGVIAVGLNMHFASREITLSPHRFARPIVVQAVVSLASVVTSSLFVGGIQGSYVFLIFLKGGVFLIFYFGISRVFGTVPYTVFAAQVHPFLEKLRVKMGKA
jgi:O-antigen/teichoic acid export membrane protein